MRRAWRAFLEELGRPYAFLHRDEFRHQYGITDVALPAVFERKREALAPWLTAPELNRCGTLEGLQKLIRARLARDGA
jgi:hypothetical protein